jgi:hypothetical protein
MIDVKHYEAMKENSNKLLKENTLLKAQLRDLKEVNDELKKKAIQNIEIISHLCKCKNFGDLGELENILLKT